MNWLDTIYGVYCRFRYPGLREFFVIPTHLTNREKVKLYRLARELGSGAGNARSIVEIGSYLGASSCFLGSALRDTSIAGRVHCIDTWENNAMSEGPRDTMQEFLRNTEQLRDYVCPVRGWSTKVRDVVAANVDKIDLLFIDGDHSYEGCRDDWLAFRSLLADDAIVVMHDIGWAEGVQQVVREEVEPLCRDCGRLPNLWWGRLDAAVEKAA